MKQADDILQEIDNLNFDELRTATPIMQTPTPNPDDPYGIETAFSKPATPTPVVDEEESDFTDGLQRGLRRTGALLRAGAGVVGGAFGAEEFQREQLQHYADTEASIEADGLSARVGRVEDIESWGDFFDYVQGLVGEQLPNIATIVASGGVGGIIAKQLAKAGIKGVARRELIKKAGSLQAQKALSKEVFKGAVKKGAKVGATGAAIGLETGGISAEQAEAGFEPDNAVALTFGTLAGGLEAAGVFTLAKSLGFGSFKNKLLKGIRELPLAKRVAVGAALSSASEGITEGAQEELAILARMVIDKEYSNSSPEAKSRLVNAVAGGGLIGGGVGAVGGVFNGREKTVTTEDIQEETDRVEGDIEATPEVADGDIDLSTEAEKGEIELPTEGVLTAEEVDQLLEEQRAEEAAEKLQEQDIDADKALADFADKEEQQKKMEGAKLDAREIENEAIDPTQQQVVDDQNLVKRIEEIGGLLETIGSKSLGNSKVLMDMIEPLLLEIGNDATRAAVANNLNVIDYTARTGGLAKTAQVAQEEGVPFLNLDSVIMDTTGDNRLVGMTVRDFDNADSAPGVYRVLHGEGTDFKAYNAHESTQEKVDYELLSDKLYEQAALMAEKMLPNSRIIMADVGVNAGLGAYNKVGSMYTLGDNLFVLDVNVRNLLEYQKEWSPKFTAENSDSNITSSADYVKDFADMLAYTVVTHEMGHAVIEGHLDQATRNQKAALVADYSKWLDEALDMDVREFLRTRTSNINRDAFFASTDNESPATVREVLKNQQGDSPQDLGYYLSFSEWSAWQMEQYMLKRGTGNSKLTTDFFRELLKQFRLFFNRLRKDNPSLLTESFENFVQLITDREHAKSRQIELSETVAALKDPDIKAAYDGQVNLATSLDGIMKGSVREAKAKQVAGEGARWRWWSRWGENLLQITENNLHIPGMAEYTEAIRTWWAEKSLWVERAQVTIDQWKAAKLNEEEQNRFGKVLTELTLLSDKQFAQAEADGVGMRKMDATVIQAVFEKHGFKDNLEVQELYAKIQADFTGTINALYNNLMSRAKEDLQFQDPLLYRKTVRRYQIERANLTKREYFPLSRFGKYWVWRRDKNGQTISYESFESEAAAEAKMASLRAKFKDSSVSRGVNSEEIMQFAYMPPQMYDMMADSLKLDENQRKELADLRHRTAEGQGFRKNLLNRKGTAGFSEDAMRGYANYMFNFSNYNSRIRNEHQMNKAMVKMEDYIDLQNLQDGSSTVKNTQLLDWIKRHKSYIFSAGQEFTGLRAFGFMWYLGYNVKSAVVNLTQVPMVTAPYLSYYYGTAGATREIARSTADIRKIWSKGEGLGADEASLTSAIEEGIKAGFLDESMATDLAALREGTSVNQILPDAIKGNQKAADMIRKINEGGAYMFQKVEKVNRLITFASAFRLEMQAQQAKGITGKRARDTAYIAGRTAVEKTQFEYARWNRPAFMRGPTSPVFLFMNYMQNLLWMLGNSPANLRIASTLLLMGGIMGMPGADDLTDGIDAFLDKFGASLGLGDSKSDIKLEMRETIQGLLTQLGAEDSVSPDLFMHGLSRHGLGLPFLANMAGVSIPSFDISGSISVGNIIPDSKEASLGAVADVAFQFAKAVTDTKNPDDWKRWERTFPSAVKGLSQGLRYAVRGEETGFQDETVREFDPSQPEDMIAIGMRMMGFSLTEIRQQQDLSWVKMEHRRYYVSRRASLYAQYWYATTYGTPTKQKAILRRIKTFNATVPSPALTISMKQLKASYLKRQKNIALRNRGTNADKRFRGIDEVINSKMGLLLESTEE